MDPMAILRLILILTALAGGILVLWLFAEAMLVAKPRRLSHWRNRQVAFADLLNYAAVVDDGVVIGKNGAFMAGWIYQAADNASATPQERNDLSARINQALSRLDNGWMIHVDAVRREAPRYPAANRSFFPDTVSAEIDEERRRFFERRGVTYTSAFVMVVTWFPPQIATQKLGEFLFDDDRPRLDSRHQTMELIEKFKRELDTLENTIGIGLKLSRLKGVEVVQEDGSKLVYDDFLRWLQFCATGKSHPILLPSNPMYLDAVVGAQEMWSGVVPRIGEKFVSVIALDGFPPDSSPGLLNGLSDLTCEYRWSTRFIFMDQQEALGHLNGYRKKWHQKERGFLDQVFRNMNGRVDQDAVAMVRDADRAIADLNSGLVAQGYYTSVIVLMHEDRAVIDDDTRKLEKAITTLGFNARIETFNTIEAFLGSLPGHGTENVRRPILNTMNLADLLPSSSIWPGQDHAPCPMYGQNLPPLMECVTQGATPFHFNLHTRDLGHTFLFGPTGAGKSTHLALLAAQARRYNGMTIFAFDKGMSMYTLCAGVGVKHFVVGRDEDQLSLCPMQFIESRSERAWAAEWIDTILALNGVQTTPSQRNAIASALDNMAKSGAKTLTDFAVVVQDEAIRSALQQYQIDGVMGHLIDAAEDGLRLSSFTVFEIEELLNLGEKYALPVLLYLFRRIERALRGQPAMIILDEAWIMLANDVFREKIREWLKVMRKANCAVVMATQSLSDAAKSDIFDVIVESTATKIFLPNVYARDENFSATYRAMGLNTRQIELIATAIPKKQYYVVAEGGRRLYELALGPVALSFVGATDKDSIAAIKALEQRFGPRWVDEWLRQRNVQRPQLRQKGFYEVEVQEPAAPAAARPAVAGAMAEA